MSEKEKAIVEEIVHWSHEHPLALVETITNSYCFGCRRYFNIGEQAYGCSKKCGCERSLHEECARLPRRIRHLMHPQHILIQQYSNTNCAILKYCIWDPIAYYCTSSECKFGLHMGCAKRDYGEFMDAADDDDDIDEETRGAIHHPSHDHPKHELRLLRNSSFLCDACGTTRKGNSYLCTVCQYWIHERCANLPQTITREKDHHHSLSLSFHVPPQYLKYKYRCNVCNKYLFPKYWIYHCHLCSYVVHVKCAFNNSPHATRNNAGNEKGIIQFPINDAAEELITPFVKRHAEGGAILAPPIPHDDDDEMVNNVKYKFIHHEHQLTLVSSLSSHHHRHHQNDDEEEEDDDDYGKRSRLICDGCITPIYSSSSSSSSSSCSEKKDCYYYMSCSECKYYLHLACFHLPHQLLSLPLHDKADHDLVLKSCDKLKLGNDQYCYVCEKTTNGLFYKCMKCDYFKADIKCASLPDTIYHAAHPQHLLKYMFITISSFAADCGSSIVGDHCYTCDSCSDFIVHLDCAVLPALVSSRRWDKHHPLPLTYDANLNHPGEFYCDECETQMNPKSWMYHCRHCDLSFHPECFRVTSGWLRNIKFGKEYVIPKAHHPHPLTYQLLTTKRRCDLCGGDRHEYPGFHCASCNFFICFYYCVQKMIAEGDKIHAVG